MRTIRVILTALVVGVTTTTTTLSAPCELVPERQIIDGLLGEDWELANQGITGINPVNSLIGSRIFYTRLVEWVSSLPHVSGGDVEPLLDAIEQELTSLEGDHNLSKTTTSKLAWGLAAAHTARMMLADGEVIKGIRFASSAISALQSYLDAPDASDQGRAAASFAIGVFYIYSNAIPSEFLWASNMVSKSGTMEQGRSLIEYSIQKSSVLAPEAVRTLLLETPWQTPLYCDYLDLSRQLVDSYPQNPDLSIARQALLLRCGYPEAALHENSRISSQGILEISKGYYDEDYLALVRKGRQRALADLGYATMLEPDETGEIDDHFQKYALANALDIQGNRTRALTLYKQLVADRDTPVSVRKNAKARFNIPYQRRETIEAQRSLTMAVCTDN